MDGLRIGDFKNVRLKVVKVAESIPPEVQTKLMKLQQLQEQLSAIRAQRQSVELELREVSRVLDEIKELPEEEEVYESIGHILVKRKKDDVQKKLDERREILELRLKTLTKQEANIATQIEDLRRKIAGMLAKTRKLS